MNFFMNISRFLFLITIYINSKAFAIEYIVDVFEKWIQTYEITIQDRAHYDTVFQKWISNHKYIESTNSHNLTYTLGHNHFSGMDTNDFRDYLSLSTIIVKNHRKLSIMNTTQSTSLSTDLPSSVDWVEKGAVTPVKDQGQCGSCWTFSTTGALEGAYAIHYVDLVSFSEQQLVDCDNFKNGGRNFGCNGGVMDSAFDWISKKGGLCTESEYPYVSGTTEKSETCEKTCQLVSKSQIQNHVDVSSSSDTNMMEAIAQQPVSVAIEADQRDFQLYKSGVFTGSCGTDLDHGVLVVGYGSLNGEDYYKVKNSWGTSWGENGYILLGRGSKYNSGDGQCGVLLQASYPVL